MLKDTKMRFFTTIVSFILMTNTLFGSDTILSYPVKSVNQLRKATIILPYKTEGDICKNKLVQFEGNLGQQLVDHFDPILHNNSASWEIDNHFCTSVTLLFSKVLFSSQRDLNEQLTFLHIPNPKEDLSNIELAVPPPGDCPLLEALAKDLADPDIGPALNAYLDELLTEGSVRVKAWKKINDGGINDFISTPGYIKTLEKVAKYHDEATAGTTGNVKYYRVQTQHPDSKILKVETNGNLTFNKPNVSLNLSTTTREHADYYAAQKIAQGNTVEIIEFEVPKAFDIQMKKTAVPQHKASQNLLNPDGTAPKIVDPLQPGDPFELPGFWNQLVQQSYIPGSAKIVN